CTRRIGRHDEERSLGQDAAAWAVLGERHAAHLRALDTGNSVVLRERFVDEGVIAIEELEHASVLADDVIEHELCLAPHRLTERRVQLFAKTREPAEFREFRFLFGSSLLVGRSAASAAEIGE